MGRAVLTGALIAAPVLVGAQQTRTSPASTSTGAATRLAILAAENRRAVSAQDLRIIRSGTRSADGQTARIAVRALGRLERPDLIPDILPGLKHGLPEIRAEAANAVAQAAQGRARASSPRPGGAASWLESAWSALEARLSREPDANVRSSIAEAIGRLPYSSVGQMDAAERALLTLLQRSQSVADRVGVAGGLEALSRTRRKLDAPTTAALESLRSLAARAIAPRPAEAESRSGGRSPIVADPGRDARVRRLALEALAATGAIDDSVARRATDDPDAQVRRLTMRAVSAPQTLSPSVALDTLRRGLADPSPMVRLEALRTTGARAPSALGEDQSSPPPLDACTESIRAVRDVEPHVALVAIDQLAKCPTLDAIGALEEALAGWAEPSSPRTWHRPAHALVALAAGAPERAAAALPRFARSTVVHLRIYAARAAVVLGDRRTLEMLAGDADDNVREAAIDGLVSVAGHAADAVYIGALSRGGYQVVRAAAIALAGTRATDAVAALTAANRRLVVEGRDNSLSARTSIADALRSLGITTNPGAVRTPTPARSAGPSLTAAGLRRVASARARVTIRGVGTFELAVIGDEAPATAWRFVTLVESGYYNGLTMHRVAPNFVIQGGSPGANEYVGDSPFMRDEVGRWPHVRGAVGISTRGRDTGDAQIFIDLVDNPRLDHEYTVFAHVLSGMEVVDAILEGDVIDRIEIVRGP